MTAHKKRIVLYGSSIVVCGVGAVLERMPDFDVLCLPVAGEAELDAADPDVVIFDESVHAAPAFALLERRPGLLVLSVSPEDDVVGCWSRRQYRAFSSRDLAGLIEQGAQPSAVWHAVTEDQAEASAEWDPDSGSAGAAQARTTRRGNQ